MVKVVLDTSQGGGDRFTVRDLAAEPSVEMLRDLVGGILPGRLGRAVRLWSLLDGLYPSGADGGRGDGSRLSGLLDSSRGAAGWRYAELRDRLFVAGHPTGDGVTGGCDDRGCWCWRTGAACLGGEDWLSRLVAAGVDRGEAMAVLAGRPFAIVHRALRKDLAVLVRGGWLELVGRGCYRRVAVSRSSLSVGSRLESGSGLVSLLEDVAFVDPSVEPLLEGLTERDRLDRRVFLHLDYVLDEVTRDQVDDHQEVLRQFWRSADLDSVGVVGFNYSRGVDQVQWIATYPVCLHYLRRSKYLSGFGMLGTGGIGWHNFRLDRIVGEVLVLDWGDQRVPAELRSRRSLLPGVGEVRSALAAAWGFTFYEERVLLLMRFDREFARRYVDGTVRHETFLPIAFEAIPGVIARDIRDVEERAMVSRVWRRLAEIGRSGDRFYRAWVRPSDINLVMRLRDWRPLGEVLAPVSLRRRMWLEARQELGQYEGSGCDGVGKWL